MSKKHTIEFIKQQFELEGYELLEDAYINAHTKMKYRCTEGHESSIRWNDWQSGCRCSYCAGNGKPTIEFIKSQFEKENYVLLSNKYVNNKTKLDYRCPEGHEHSIICSSWREGHRCPTCVGSAKLTIEFVRAKFEKEGFILLSKEYVNSKTKLDYTCPQGHKHSMLWGNFQQGARCLTCATIQQSGHNHYNWKGGLSFEPYCEVWTDKQFKADIRERDGNTCQNPDCWHSAKRLGIHHIDYDKKNCHPDNLITLCTSCNSRANTNRTWHTEFYNTINNSI